MFDIVQRRWNISHAPL